MVAARVAFSLLLLLASVAAAAAKPERIVSLNLCADVLLLHLVEPERIAAVTWLARDASGSPVAEAAARVPINHGLAEEIILLEPDLIVAGRYTTRTTVGLLERLGMPVFELDVPETFDGMWAQIRALAAAVGEHERGERMIAEMTARLAASRPPPGERPRALVLRPNGFTVGRGSLVDRLMEEAGLRNLAVELDLAAHAQVPLEAVVLSRADVLILNDGRDGPPSLASEMLHHPAIAALAGRLKIISVPSRSWTCAGPQIVDAVALLAEGAAR